MLCTFGFAGSNLCARDVQTNRQHGEGRVQKVVYYRGAQICRTVTYTPTDFLGASNRPGHSLMSTIAFLKKLTENLLAAGKQS